LAVSYVHQCPYCECRFVSRNELEDHIAVDHPRTVEDDTDKVRGSNTPHR
jgi:hypothetical protein